MRHLDLITIVLLLTLTGLVVHYFLLTMFPGLEEKYIEKFKQTWIYARLSYCRQEIGDWFERRTCK